MNKKHWIDDIPVLLQCLVNIQDRIKAGLDYLKCIIKEKYM